KLKWHRSGAHPSPADAEFWLGSAAYSLNPQAYAQGPASFCQRALGPSPGGVQFTTGARSIEVQPERVAQPYEETPRPPSPPDARFHLANARSLVPDKLASARHRD